MGTEDIYNYRRVDDRLITSGQPTEDQLRSARDEGVTTVINLAPTEPGRSLRDEAVTVRGLGMRYVHIPVAWTDPKPRDFQAFETAMQERPAGATLVHCVANFRASAFYVLYAQKHLGWSQTEAEAFRAPIWRGSNYPIWEGFIHRMRGELANVPEQGDDA